MRKRGSWSITHGMSKTPMYKVWSAMKRRCFFSSDKGYKWYGARGIKVCERWMEFKNFYKDMGLCPKGLQLDRINTNGDYDPSNCRWTDPTTQGNNRRDNHMLTYKGKTMTMAKWIRECGINKTTFIMRLRRGWSLERAMTKPRWNR